jgi:choline dehydrogenase-like flavoprotein
MLAAEYSDVIVVGSGPCGAIAARTLVHLGVQVTMMDAGNPVRGLVMRAGGHTIVQWRDGATLRNDRHVATGDPNTSWYSSPASGGLSNHWSAAVLRMSPEEFINGEALDERFRWPITYDDLAPYYDLVEETLAPSGGPPSRGLPASKITHPVVVPNDWSETIRCASDRNYGMGVLPMALGKRWMAASRPPAFNSYHSVVRPMLGHPRFTLLRNAVAVRIDHGSGDASLEYLDRATGELRVLRSRAIVVAAGALDSAALLLRSTSPDFPTGLGNSGGLVGKYLHDHPRQWFNATLARPMTLLSHPLYIAPAQRCDSNPMAASILTLHSPRRLSGNALLNRLDIRTKAEALIARRSDTLSVQTFATMIPQEECCVRLMKEPGPRDDPMNDTLEINLHFDQSTPKVLAKARDRFADALDAGGVRAMPIGPFEEPRPGLSAHYGGTVRMHDDPSFGVLDRWNRVHDAPNVIVCDSSCFTTGPAKHPTLTAMAIAARAASKLARDLGAATQA